MKPLAFGIRIRIGFSPAHNGKPSTCDITVYSARDARLGWGKEGASA